jgi:hypothetical protein
VLFGAGEVLVSLGWLLAIGFIYTLVKFIFIEIGKFFDGLQVESSEARKDKRAWRYIYIFWLGLIGNFIVMILAGISWFEYGGEFDDAIKTIPYWWGPVCIMFSAWPIKVIEILLLKF